MDATDRQVRAKQALTAFQDRNLEEARSLYATLCDEDPSDAQSWHMLGVVNGEQRRWDDAERCCRKAIALRPAAIPPYLNLASALNSMGRVEESERCYRRILSMQPDSVQARHNLGKVVLLQGRHSEAIECFNAALAVCPDDGNLHNSLAIALRKQGKLDKAIAACRMALDLDPESTEAWFHLAVLEHRQGNDAGAEAACRQVLQRSDGHADAWSLLELALHQEGKLDEARLCYGRVKNRVPGHVDIHLNLAQAYMDVGKSSIADAICEEVLADQPRLASAWYLQGMAAREQAMYERAIACFKQAIAFDQSLIEAHCNLASLYLMRGDHNATSRQYKLARNIQSDHAEVVAGESALLERLGQVDAAYERIHPLIASGTDNVPAAIAFMQVSHHHDADKEAAELGERLLAEHSLSVYQRTSLHFSLGKLYDRQGAFDAAFSHYEQGNRLKSSSFDTSRFFPAIEELTRTFSRDLIVSAPRASNQSSVPVFIVGMPRSGTSLVEHILSSHANIFGAGEMSEIHNFAVQLPSMLGSDLPYPACVRNVDEQTLDTLAESYLGKLKARTGNIARVTDKLPGNFFQLGLIELLFPRSRIIHCVRDPLDTCLSCYFQHFSGGHHYAYNLSHLGVYYSGYKQLMAHWKTVLGIPVLEVQYEDLVARQEKVSRAMVEFCGLDWDDRCLLFHESGRIARTASYAQVRRPMYTSSVGRWRNYEQHLALLKEALHGKL